MVCIFFIPFLKAENVYSRSFSRHILTLCMVSIQERVIVVHVRYLLEISVCSWEGIIPLFYRTNIYPCLGRHHYYFLSFPTLYQQPFWRVHLIQGCWSLYCCLRGQTMFFFLAVFRGKDQRLLFCHLSLPVLLEHFL